MALDIPLPGSFGKAFNEGSNVGSQILYRLMQSKALQQQADTQSQLAPSQISLAKSQAIKADIESQQAQQKMAYLQKLIGNPNSTQTTQTTQTTQQPQNQNTQDNQQQPQQDFTDTSKLNSQQRHARAAAMHDILGNGFGKMEIKDVDGTQYAFTPFDKPIPLISGPSSLQKELNKKTANTVDTWNKNSENIMFEVNPLMRNIKDAISSPAFLDIKQNPKLFGHDMWWYRSNGTKEQQEVANALKLNTENMRQAMLTGFKGSAREWENKIVSGGKIDEKDSIQAIYTKYEQLRRLYDLKTGLMRRANELVTSKGYQPIEAMAQAQQDVKYDDIKKSIENEMAKITKSSGYELPQKKYTEKELNDYYNEIMNSNVIKNKDKEKIKAKLDARMKQLRGG